MPAHARSRSSERSVRPSLTSRPATVVTLGVAVSALSIATLVHAPTAAQANEGVEALATTGIAVDESSANYSTESRLALIVAKRQQRVAEREARQDRKERRERRERRAAREARQERRAEARAAARAAARAPQWVFPVPGAGWSASFGESGSMWSSGHHTGQDFTAPSGTPVHAVSAGTITSATWSDAYGNIIEITHPNGDQSWYAHMSGFAQTSGPVSAGEVIGYVGCTGNCFGNHLHFEYHPGGGGAADPVAWLQRNDAS